MKNLINCWRNNTNLVLTLLLFLTPLIGIAAAPSISGAISVCEGDVITYTYPYTPGNTYNWGSTGGTGIATINTGGGTAVFTMTWGLAGSGTITLQEYAGATLVVNHTVNITINDAPNPLIVSNFDSDCVTDPADEEEGQKDPRPPSFECETVCEDSPVTYTTPNVAVNTYQWSVIGAYTSISGATTSTATVTWGAPGQAFVVVTETTPAGCSQTDTTCIIIVDKPISEFEVAQPGGAAMSSPASSSANTIEICLNSTVCFNDLSVGASSWFWDFGNSSTSNLQSPCETFTVAGNYLVTQIVENECHCTDTSYIYVKVRSDEGPDIVCQNVVCDNGTFTYDAILPTPCSGGYYEWSISNNGTITAASGSATINPQSADGIDVTSITVNWGSGPTGTINLILNGCGSICDAITSVNIPIIPNTIDITGDEAVCVGESGYFEVPCFPGTIYTWRVNGNLIYETGNELWYEFSSPGNNTVTVDYDNSFLNCSGSSSTFNVSVLFPFEINGPANVCENSSLLVSGPAASQLTWVVTDQSGTTVATSGVTSSSSYTVLGSLGLAPGTYTVTAQDASSPREFCGDAIHGFTVIAAPPPPTIINGSDEVCAGEAYTYTASPTSSNYYLEWTVINSGTNTTSNGNSVTVTWGTGINRIRLFQVSKTGNCRSSRLVMRINPKSLPAINISGSSVECANTEAASPITYSTTAILDGYDWSIIPTNAGSVVAGQGTNTISVIWNNWGGTANVSLIPELCNLTYTAVNYPVLVTAPVMSITGPTTVCENSGGTWNSSFTPAGSPSGQMWSITDISNTPVAGGSGGSANFNFNNLSGSFILTMTATNCASIHTETFNITVNPAPVANLSYTGQIGCIDQQNVTLLLSVQGSGPFTYEWFHNSSSLGNLGISHNIGMNASDAGNWYVIIKNTVTGCTSQTNMLIAQPCSTPTGNCTQHSSTVNFNYTVAQNAPSPGCNLVNFTSGYTGMTPATYYWNFAGLATASGTNTSYTFPASGVYPVTVITSYGNPYCDTSFTYDVVVPVIADFDINISCAGGSNLNVDLINTSDVIHGPLSLFAHNWTITPSGGGAAITSSNQNFNSVPSLVPGQTYTISLEESRTYTWGGQSINAMCTYSETFVMPDNAAAAFDIINPIVCEGNPVLFDDQSAGSIIGRRWLFGDTPASEILTTDPEKTYTTPGFYNVTLEVTDEFGCVNTSAAQQVDVRTNAIAGNISISPVQPMCPGVTANIAFNHTGSGFAPFDYLWSDNTMTISKTEDQTSTHYLGVTDAIGCFASFGPETVEVVEIPDAIITGLDVYCIGDEINLTCNYGPSYGYTWFQSINGGSFTTAGSTTTQLSLAGVPVGNHVFMVELNTTAPNCTKESFLFNVEVFGLPTSPTIITNPIPACPDSPVLLEVTNPALFNSISWTTGDVGITTSALSSGRYYAVGTDANGCSNYNYTDVHELPNFCSFMCGCYSDCIEPGVAYTFPGIPGTYSEWRWESYDGANWNTIPLASGSNSTVADLSISTAGSYIIRLYIETTDGCDGYSCEVDLMLTTCGEPCEGKARMEYVECDYDADLGVVYHFGLDLDFAPFGKDCDKYTYQIIPPSGSINSSPSYISPYGSFIDGKWFVGSNYHPGGIVCFDIIITNECDKSVCTLEVCFEIDECGDPDADQADSRRRLNGNSDNLTDDEVLFYPNPTTGMLKIKAPEKGNYQITIFDISGKVVLQHNMLIETDRVAEFNLRNLPVGPYSVQCIGNETIKTERLIILKE